MAKTVLKPTQQKILRNRKTRCKFSFSPRAMESAEIEFIKPANDEQEELIDAVRELYYQSTENDKAIKRAKKYRDMRWVEELTVKKAEIQEELDNVLYPEIDREMVTTAEDLRREEAGNTNIQVNLDAGQIAEAISNAGEKPKEDSE